MRGSDGEQSAMFSYVPLEARIPKDHPLRPVREMTDRALAKLSRRFTRLYSDVGRPSIAPERLLRALLLQMLYTIRSERMLVEQLQYNLLFRWFVGLGMDETVWDATTFTKNRDRLLEGDVASGFFQAVVEQAREHGLLSDEHFTVDGTLIEAWAGQKSFRPKDRGDDDGDGGDFHGQQRRNDTHESTTDPEAKLFRKGTAQEAKLSYMGHVLMENRNGLVVGAEVTPATGFAERETAVRLVKKVPRGSRATLGADKGYDTREFVEQLRELGVTPHVAQNESRRRSRIDGRTTRHTGYAMSQIKRKLIEQIFGWQKTVAGLRKVRHRGRDRVGWVFTFGMAAYNLVRMRNLCAA
jgi:transposase